MSGIQFFVTSIFAAMALATLEARLALAADDAPLHLTLRSRVVEGKDPKTHAPVTEKPASWDPKKTAIVVIDMWDDHWCKGAALRVNELAVPMNDMLKTARARGVFIIHSPSSVTSFYKNTPQRKLAQAAPFSAAPVPLATAERWGTKWVWPDKAREAELPIDDSDMGCDCEKHCTIREAWTRENPLIEIAPADAITDDGQECWNLLQSRGIENVILCGVHLNMCVLGRPTAIRQLVRLGKNVALIRDMTDTMYNHERQPRVNHFQGTQLVIEHVERYWCPSMLSTDITGVAPFQFKEAKAAAAK